MSSSKIRPIDIVVALYEYNPQDPKFLTLKPGSTVYVLHKSSNGWWDGVQLISGTTGGTPIFPTPSNVQKVNRGWFPANFTKSISKSAKSSYKRHNSTHGNESPFEKFYRNRTCSLSGSSSRSSILSSKQIKLEIPNTLSRPFRNSISAEDNNDNHNDFNLTSYTTSTSPLHKKLDPHENDAKSMPTPTNENIFSLSSIEHILSKDISCPPNSWNSLSWIPTLSQKTGSMLFYNSYLNVFCNELPLLPFNNHSTVAKNNNETIPPLSYNQHNKKSTPDIQSSPHSFPLTNDNISSKPSSTVSGSANYRKQPLLSTFLHSNVTSPTSVHTSTLSSNIPFNSQNSTTTLTHAKKDFQDTSLSHRDLFYFHNLDITSWASLRDSTIFVCRNLWQAFNENNQKKFFNELSILSNHIVYINLACHYYYFKANTSVKSDLKKQLKLILSILSSISLDSLIFLKPNSSTSNKCFLPEQIEADIQKLQVILDSIYNTIKINIPYSSASLLDPHSSITTDVLPQIYPRFFRHSFNGGSWSNPFVEGLDPEVFSKIYNVRTNSSSELTNTWDKMQSLLSSFSSPSSKKAFLMQNKTLARTRRAPKLDHYSLNFETFNLLQECSTNIVERLKIMEKLDQGNVHNNYTNNNKRNLKVVSYVYDEITSNVHILDILENLDLSIFVILRRILNKQSVSEFLTTKIYDLDDESEEFLKHYISSVTPILTDFFDSKQSLHDVFTRLILLAQTISVSDPYTFKSIKTDTFPDPVTVYPVAQSLPYLSPDVLAKYDKGSFKLFDSLKTKDVEFNNEEFFNSALELKSTFERYLELVNVICIIVEQLIEERENLLNYLARMMKNNIITEILQNEEQMKMNITTSDKEEEESSSDDDNSQVSNNILIAQEKDLQWFLRSNNLKDLEVDKEGIIRGGTKDALIEYLTSNNNTSEKFINCFLLTFRSMFTTMEFFYALINRYNVSPPEGLTFEEYSIWIEKKLNSIKVNVIHIMHVFFKFYWSNNYYDSGMTALVHFLNFAVSENIRKSKEVLHLLKIVLNNCKIHSNTSSKSILSHIDNQKINFNDTSISKLENNDNNSITTISTGLFKMKNKLKLLDLDPLLFAKQLTIVEQEYFIQITPFECLDRIWKNKFGNMGGSENITKFITRSNLLTNYVSYSVVKNHDIKKRGKVIQFFINVAQNCHELNNFSSMTAIISALYSSPIFRLKKTWELIPDNCKEKMKNMNNLMNSTKNFVNYRKLLKSIDYKSPCIPFFGVFLSDLTFTFAGNPDFLHQGTKIINFSKKMRIYEIISMMQKFQSVKYDEIKKSTDLQLFIENKLCDIPHIDKQYELSLEVEPREQPIPDNIKSTHHYHHTKSRPELSGPLLHFGRKK